MQLPKSNFLLQQCHILAKLCLQYLLHLTIFWFCFVFGFFLGYQHIRMYDLNSNNPNPVINYDGVSKNITSVGFHEDGRWMYTGGEDCLARIWDLRYFQGSLLW